MSNFFFIKYTGTPSTDPDFAVAAAHEDAVAIELAVLTMKHDHEKQGDATVYLGGVLVSPRLDRLVLAIKFVPFWNSLPISEDVPQNSDTLLQFRTVCKQPYLWISRPATSGLEAPTRYHDSVNFPLTYALLPVRVEPEQIESSMVEAAAWTDVSQVWRAREVSA